MAQKKNGHIQFFFYILIYGNYINVDTLCEIYNDVIITETKMAGSPTTNEHKVFCRNVRSMKHKREYNQIKKL